jgi:hypothetical protein
MPRLKSSTLVYMLMMSPWRVNSLLKSRYAVMSRLRSSTVGALQTSRQLEFLCKSDWDIEWMGRQISRMLSPGDVLLLRGMSVHSTVIFMLGGA